MSFVTVQSELLDAAAGHLAGSASAMLTENAAAAAPTTGVVPAAADPVSVLTATQFAAYGHLYQSLSSQAEEILSLFVNTLRTSAGSYALTEAANAVVAA
ncbi:PE family protein [Mycobacterium sp.]|uniref:PE family protein n=1 Tax=Mycobacterium sp. TaxID=1785 RepID=UPI00127FD24B|nr:PE family protein [Mycobacterium sp.]KAA8969622.1 MAG: PE family protein [Mycobacterium sp.]